MTDSNPTGTQGDSQGDNLKTLSMAVWALYLLSTITGITSIVGVVIAHVKIEEAAGTIWHSHLRFAIRTFWLTLLGAVISILLMFIGIGILTIIAVSVWFIVRSVIGLLKAMDQKPIANPESWLI